MDAAGKSTGAEIEVLSYSGGEIEVRQSSDRKLLGTEKLPI